jgi:hypothetical protein
LISLYRDESLVYHLHNIGILHVIDSTQARLPLACVMGHNPADSTLSNMLANLLLPLELVSLMLSREIKTTYIGPTVKAGKQ